MNTTVCEKCIRLQTTVGTNYFGHYYLTHLLLDKLVQTQKEGGMARAVFMSSTFEQLGNINWDDLEYEHTYMTCVKHCIDAALST